MFLTWRKKASKFLRANGGNVAMMFGLSLVPITIAAGTGLDFARAMMVRSSMSDALDAATLAVGATPGISASAAQVLAQSYVDANYGQNTTQYGHPVVQLPVIDSTAQTVHIVVTNAMPTTLLSVGNVIPVLNLTVSATVTWGQSRLWVALVLDNTGSMAQTDLTHTSKISALKTASHNLITTLQNASSTVGDVQMTITPFAKLVNIGTSYVNNAAIDWTDWSAEPVDQNGNAVVPNFNTGPGDPCPYTTFTDGFGCVRSPGSSSSTGTVPSSGTYSGYICPGVMQAYNAATGSGGHYFNGCYDSVAATQSSTSTSTNNSSGNFQVCQSSGSGTGNPSCTCSGAYPRTTNTTSGNTSTATTYNSCSCSNNGRSGSNRVTTCTAPYTAVATTTTTTTTNGFSHTWHVNNHSTWAGCIEDRNQDYDTNNTTPSAAGTLFPAANDDNCPATTVVPLPSTWAAAQWTTLGNQIDAMTPNGSTNQTIGLAHGWQTLTNTGPYNAPAMPANTNKVIILVSDGLNTQDRWSGDGGNQSSAVDARMALTCTNAKAAGFYVYTIFVDLGGTQGNSTVLQNCATDSSYYFDLTTSGAIVTTFATIAQRITNLRVSQ